MIIKKYEVDYMLIGVLISGVLTTIFIILGESYHYLPMLIFHGIIGYSHKPKRLTTTNTEANIG